MTNRGIERFNEGKVQESIDQFTKALAMDPNHAEAWERRAEAYTRLGRNDEADEDRRRLAAINPA
ncbi:MAG: tetratricopeptide repeat protein [Chloroflexi bacterium]|nr:tetratricopeptide repeat protein [Chloroflexota bacterium]